MASNLNAELFLADLRRRPHIAIPPPAFPPVFFESAETLQPDFGGVSLGKAHVRKLRAAGYRKGPK